MIVSSDIPVLFRYTDSDYPFGILKLFFKTFQIRIAIISKTHWCVSKLFPLIRKVVIENAFFCLYVFQTIQHLKRFTVSCDRNTVCFLCLNTGWFLKRYKLKRYSRNVSKTVSVRTNHECISRFRNNFSIRFKYTSEVATKMLICCINLLHTIEVSASGVTCYR